MNTDTKLVFQKHNIGLGKRKEAVARVFLVPGGGKIIINKISQVYFRTLVLVLIAIIGGATLTKALYDFI